MTHARPRFAHSRFAALAVLGAVCLTLTLVFARIGTAVRSRETRSLDEAVRGWMLDHQSPLASHLFGILTWLGWTPVLIAGTLVVCGILVRRGARVRPLFLCMIPFLPRLVVRALKDTFQVIRPPPAVDATSLSFPSGHTTAGTAVALVLGYILVREGVAKRVGWTIALAVPIVVGLSRMYLDMHWASDVIGGWVLGGALAGAACALYELIRSSSNGRA